MTYIYRLAFNRTKVDADKPLATGELEAETLGEAVAYVAKTFCASDDIRIQLEMWQLHDLRSNSNER